MYPAFLSGIALGHLDGILSFMDASRGKRSFVNLGIEFFSSVSVPFHSEIYILLYSYQPIYYLFRLQLDVIVCTMRDVIDFV